MKRAAVLTALVCALARAQAEDFHAEKLEAMDKAIETAITAGKTPGGVLWLEHKGATYHKAYGARAVEPERVGMTEDTIFDAASLTKVMATTPAVMLLIERGKIELDAPVKKYWPEFGAAGKEDITIKHLLTHTSGLPPGLATTLRDALEQTCAQSPTVAAGTKFRYSDINFIALGEVVHRVSGQTLDQFCAAEIYGPLKMTDTGFRPDEKARARIAPTTRDVPVGAVHDPTSRRMGGVAGHAGLFTTTSDLARYARMYLHGGELDGTRIFKEETVKRMTTVQTAKEIKETRGLGWDIDSPFAAPRGDRFPVGGYGHSGWTGGSVWIDPASETFVIFLSNRNHPTESGNVNELRRTLGTLAAEAVAGL